ncbi:MAG TPA: Calx-beta domain-containing protein [Thermoanaerobaculia bacterium]
MARLFTILGFVCAFSGAMEAATFTVTTNADAGAGSLRQAILDANANGNAVVDTIAFNIPGAGVQTIVLAGPLPSVTTPVLIDGYTQPGSSVNTLTFDNGTNAAIRISLDGANFGFLALELQTGAFGSTVRGLNLQRFSTAIWVNGPNGIRIDGNFIGTDATGTIARGNGIGILFGGGANNSIVGDLTPALRNVISGNDVGVYFQQASQNNSVRYNYVGTNAAGTAAIPNLTGIWVEGVSNVVQGNLISGSTGIPNSTGVLVTNSSFDAYLVGNRIGTQANGVGSIPNNYGVLVTGGGGETPTVTTVGDVSLPNVIANSLLDGIAVRALTPPSTSGRFVYNTYRNNGGLGIDLHDDGVTPNDPLDADTGANQLQNFPVITSAARTVGGAAVITGTLNSEPSTQYRIQLYFNIGCNASGFGEGGYVTEATVTTDATGAAAFTFNLPSLPAGFVSALAWRTSNDNVSEFSQCVQVVTEDPRLSVNDRDASEGNAGTSPMTFTVSLDAPSQFPITVNVQTSDDTATAPSDYVAAATTLVFAPGEVSKPFTVTINGDATVEPTEAFFVTLSAPVNASILDDTGAGTITNDDVAGAVDLSIMKSGPSTVSGGSPVTYTLTVANTGSANATNVVVTDPLPSGVVFVSATPSQGTCSGTTTITCTLGTLNAGASATITLNTLASATPQNVSNTASVTANETEPNTTNNASTVPTTITALAAVPALSTYGLMAVAALLAAVAFAKLR